MSATSRQPRRGDVWQRKSDSSYLLITTAWGGIVLARSYTDCPEAGCQKCRNTTHKGFHLGEVEEAYTEPVWHANNVFVSAPTCSRYVKGVPESTRGGHE